ncbi:MAG: EamA family transporter, partial [Planctomycetota bacterium]|nr:EamA family transporter [Planctomycetota bacterium]
MSQTEARQGRTAVLAPLAVALIWGINVPVMKAGLAELDPFLFNAARLTLSALSLGLFSLREPLGGGRLPWPT